MEIKELNGQIYQVLKSLAQSNNDYSQLNALIRKVFSSLDLLNLSFKQYYNKKVTKFQPNLNLIPLQLFYKDILENSTQFRSGFVSVIQSLLKYMQIGDTLTSFIKEGDASYSNMRFILILLYCPIIYDSSDRSSYIDFVRAFGQLRDYQRESLAHWLIGMSGERLEEIVLYSQGALSSLVDAESVGKHENKQLGQILSGCCEFLGILCKSNKLKPRIAASHFKNKEIMNHFKPAEQYKTTNKTPLLKLVQYPFLLDTHYKLKIMQLQNQQQQQLKMEQGMLYLIQNAEDQEEYLNLNSSEIQDLHLVIKINRNNILADTKQQIMGVESLKSPLKVEFIGEIGNDDGGIKKECLQLLTKELFDPLKHIILTKNNNRFHWLNPNYKDLSMFQFIGVVVGLAIYNQVMLDLKFPLVFYKKLVSEEGEKGERWNTLEELMEIEPDFYKTFRYILDTHQSLDSMELTFTADNLVMGKRTSIPLTHKGQLIRVTQFNKTQYVDLYIKYILEQQIATQFQAFKKGFYNVVSKESIKLFQPEQLQIVLCGLQVISFIELRKSAKYEGYSPDSVVVMWLWEILEGLSQEKKKGFLFFATGSDRSPIGGLSTMSFTIQRHGPDTENVLSAHTCSNVLLLPQYCSKQKLQKKLLVALSHNHGFGLI